MRALLGVLAFTVAVCGAAEIELVGVMVSSDHQRFALRPTGIAHSQWLTLGDSIEGFSIAEYDPKSDTLTLRKGAAKLELRLPEARVRMAKDETIAGFSAVLRLTDATHLRDLLHPKLRPLFKEEDLDKKQFPDLTAPGVKLELLPLTEEEQRALAQGILEVEKFLGVKPTHGVWIKTAKGASMSFVVEMGGRWFLAPSVPGMPPKPRGRTRRQSPRVAPTAAMAHL